MSEKVSVPVANIADVILLLDIPLSQQEPFLAQQSTLGLTKFIFADLVLPIQFLSYSFPKIYFKSRPNQ